MPAQENAMSKKNKNKERGMSIQDYAGTRESGPTVPESGDPSPEQIDNFENEGGRAPGAGDLSVASGLQSQANSAESPDPSVQPPADGGEPLGAEHTESVLSEMVSSLPTTDTLEEEPSDKIKRLEDQDLEVDPEVYDAETNHGQRRDEEVEEPGEIEPTEDSADETQRLLEEQSFEREYDEIHVALVTESGSLDESYRPPQDHGEECIGNAPHDHGEEHLEPEVPEEEHIPNELLPNDPPAGTDQPAAEVPQSELMKRLADLQAQIDAFKANKGTAKRVASGSKARPNVIYTLLAKPPAWHKTPQVAQLQQLLFAQDKRELNEVEIFDLVKAGKEAGVLRTSQEAVRIFQYYRNDLLNANCLRWK